ncbi:MAG: chorismate mutase [Kiritimatiellaeota bacterium]|nr:chorismate mutase [Kiritimatiellota bacterium]
MNEQLLLSNIRNVLIRLEETIIFALIERAQFRHNEIIYRKGAFPNVGSRSLVGYLLHETEAIHAKMRRYTSPDEHPFFSDLPEPILPALRYDEDPLHPNRINLNDRIRMVYEQQIVPFVCTAGDDAQYGSSSVCDVACLQALSRRIHYGKFVAESKFRAEPERFRSLIVRRDTEAVMAAITDARVEQCVLERVRLKAQTYGRDISTGPEFRYRLHPERVVELYASWIIPLTKEVEVAYLMDRVPGD